MQGASATVGEVGVLGLGKSVEFLFQKGSILASGLVGFVESSEDEVFISLVNRGPIFDFPGFDGGFAAIDCECAHCFSVMQKDSTII